MVLGTMQFALRRGSDPDVKPEPPVCRLRLGDIADGRVVAPEIRPRPQNERLDLKFPTCRVGWECFRLFSKRQGEQSKLLRGAPVSELLTGERPHQIDLRRRPRLQVVALVQRSQG